MSPWIPPSKPQYSEANFTALMCICFVCLCSQTPLWLLSVRGWGPHNRKKTNWASRNEVFQSQSLKRNLKYFYFKPWPDEPRCTELEIFNYLISYHKTCVHSAWVCTDELCIVWLSLSSLWTDLAAPGPPERPSLSPPPSPCPHTLTSCSSVAAVFFFFCKTWLNTF